MAALTSNRSLLRHLTIEGRESNPWSLADMQTLRHPSSVGPDPRWLPALSPANDTGGRTGKCALKCLHIPVPQTRFALHHGEWASQYARIVNMRVLLYRDGLCTKSFANFSTGIFDVPRSLQDQQLTKLLLGVGTNSRKRSYTTSRRIIKGNK